jgi:hypothetical protein
MHKYPHVNQAKRLLNNPADYGAISSLLSIPLADPIATAVAFWIMS